MITFHYIYEPKARTWVLYLSVKTEKRMNLLIWIFPKVTKLTNYHFQSYLIYMLYLVCQSVVDYCLALAQSPHGVLSEFYAKLG